MSWLAGIGSILSAGGSLLGGMMGSSAQAQLNQQQMNFNAQQASENRGWQEYMSNSAYTRAMGDMRNAGLNPILAANLGGASTPGGSVGSISGLVSPGSLMGQGVASAAQAGQTFLQLKSAQAQAEKDSTQADLNKTAGDLNNASADNLKKQNENIGKQGDEILARTRAADAAARASDASAGASAVRAGLDAQTTATEIHNTNSARYRAEQEQQKAERDRLIGAPKGSEVGRSIQDIGGWLGNVFNSNTAPGQQRSAAPSSAKGIDNLPPGYNPPPNAPYVRTR